MKKSLVALAALAATASFAQSTVTITGIVDANYQSTKQVGDQPYSFVGQNGARTTAFKFTGTEDLGGGQSAVFMYEVDPVMIGNNGNTLTATTTSLTTLPNAGGVTQQKGLAANAQSGLVGAGEAYVGFNDAQYGSVKLGTVNSNIFNTYAAVSVMGTGIGTGYNNGVIPSITRFESAVRYDTPVISGFSGGVLRGTGNDNQFGSTASTGQTVTLRRPTVTDYSVQYANGPLTAKYGLMRSTNGGAETTPNVTTTLKLMGVAYDAGVAKVTYGTGSYRNDANPATLDANINVMGVVVPFMGTYRFLAQSTYVKYTTAPSATGISGEKNKIMGWGFEKDLSKRTFVYLRAENADFSANLPTTYIVNGAAATGSTWGASNAANSKRTVTALGISHQF